MRKSVHLKSVQVSKGHLYISENYLDTKDLDLKPAMIIFVLEYDWLKKFVKNVFRLVLANSQKFFKQDTYDEKEKILKI